MASKEEQWLGLCKAAAKRAGILARMVAEAVTGAAARYEKGLKTIGLIPKTEAEAKPPGRRQIVSPNQQAAPEPREASKPEMPQPATKPKPKQKAKVKTKVKAKPKAKRKPKAKAKRKTRPDKDGGTAEKGE